MSARNKILKPAGQQPDELEMQVAQALFDLEQSDATLKPDLRPIQFTACKQITSTSETTDGGRKALLIYIPVPLMKQVHRIQQRLVRELEKKFADRHVLFLGHRKIMAKPLRRTRQKQMRPRSRTLTSVHEGVMEDMVYPTEIVGKRCRVSTDGTKVVKVLLDGKDRNAVEYKLDTYASVYRKLTGKQVTFDFHVDA